MNRVAVIARFRPDQAELVRGLLTAGPPYDLAETAIDRHAVFLSAREVAFVFEGPDVEWEVEDLADDFFNPEVRAALTVWRPLLEEEPLDRLTSPREDEEDEDRPGELLTEPRLLPLEDDELPE